MAVRTVWHRFDSINKTDYLRSTLVAVEPGAVAWFKKTGLVLRNVAVDHLNHLECLPHE